MSTDDARVISVNVTAKVHVGAWRGDVGRTGIDKRPISTATLFAHDSVANDVVADRKNHGGYDKAVYAYAREVAEWWEGELGIPLSPGKFGENLTTQGIDLRAAVIGERWQVGDAVLEVAQPRTPCRVFAGFWERPNLIKEFTDAGRAGAYLRIIEEGLVDQGDKIIVVERPGHGVTVAEVFTARGEERFRLFEILAGQDSSESVRQWALKLLVRK